MTSSPVLVLIKANGCGACTHLTKFWPECLRQMKEVVPNLIEVSITKPSLSSPINTNNYPAILTVFNWFPTVLLVPGKSWQDAVSQVSSGAMVPLPGAQIFNGSWVTSVTVKQDIGREVKYNLFNPQDCRNWILQAIQAEEFRRANMQPLSSLPLLPPSSSGSTSPFLAANPAAAKINSSACKVGYILVPKLGAHSR